MRGIKYFDIDLKTTGKLHEHVGVNIKESPINTSDLMLWKKSLSEKEFNGLVKGLSSIDILIPYHNSFVIENVLSDILGSHFPKEFKLRIIIIASNCSKVSQDLIRELKTDQRTNTEIEIIIENNPGKPLALNKGLATTQSPIVIQVVDDITFSPSCLPLLYISLLLNSDYGAAVITGLPRWPDKGKPSILQQVQQIHFDKFYKNDQYALIGRLFAFRPELINKHFPEDIMSEDFWLEMQVREKSKGFLVIDHASLTYTPPLSWSDYFKQINRYDKAFKQLKRRLFPLFTKHYGDVNNSINSLLGNSDKKTGENLMHFFKKERYGMLAKIVYLIVIVYQIYFLAINEKLFPAKNALFTREQTTI